MMSRDAGFSENCTSDGCSFLGLAVGLCTAGETNSCWWGTFCLDTTIGPKPVRYLGIVGPLLRISLGS